jgi:hypothetical protein
MPNGHEASIEILLRCAAYRFHFGDWPTRLRIGPFELCCLAREMPSAEEFMRFPRRLEIVIRQDWDADDARELVSLEPQRPGARWPLIAFPIEVSGEAGTVPPERALIPPLRDRAEHQRWEQNEREVREWLGFEWPDEQCPPDETSKSMPTAQRPAKPAQAARVGSCGNSWWR